MNEIDVWKEKLIAVKIFLKNLDYWQLVQVAEATGKALDEKATQVDLENEAFKTMIFDMATGVDDANDS